MAKATRFQDRTAVEDYLKTMWSLAEWTSERDVTNAAVADRLKVSTSSVSEMVRRLTSQGLVHHEPWGSIELTAEGHREATAVVRRHRLLETFLFRLLDYSWDQVHDEAEVLEHAASPFMIERVDRLLGFPYRDPHGDPIPTPGGAVHRPMARPLIDLPVGYQGYVARIIDEDSELLRWFSDHDLGLDTAIRVAAHEPFGGPLLLDVGEVGSEEATQVALGVQAVTSFWVAEQRPVSPYAAPHPTLSLRPGCPYPDCQHDTSS